MSIRPARDAQDLLFMSQALGIASQGSVKFMSPEHAKAIWVEYLRVSGFDVPKKNLPVKQEKVETGK